MPKLKPKPSFLREKMKKIGLGCLSVIVLIVAVMATCGRARAQGPTPVPPDCQIFLNSWTSARSSTAFPNYFTGCTSWTLQYTSVGFSGLTLTVQSAPAATATTPGAFVNFAGTVATGINPNTSTTGAVSTFSNGAVDIPWVRVTLSGLTGSGTVFGVLYGYKTGYTGGGGSAPGSGCVGTVGTPCVVDGPTAAGSPSVNAPVQVAGNDGTNIQNIKTDTSGEIINNPLGAATAQADGATNTPTVPEANGAAIKMPTYPFKFNSSTWDKDFACTNQANITVSSGTSAKIISGVASTQVRICHISISSSTAADFTIQQGTGSVCGSSTVSITGTYKNVTAVALDFQPTAALRTTVAASDVCVLFGATVTAGGTVIYAQY
jgi:hypothetical protein